MNSMPYAHPFCDVAKPPILGGFALSGDDYMVKRSRKGGQAVSSHIFLVKSLPQSRGKAFSAPCGWTALRRLIVSLRNRDGIFHRGRGASAGGRRGGWRCLTVCHLPADVSWPGRWMFPVCREEVLHGGHGHQTPISLSAAFVSAYDSYLHIYDSTDFIGN